MAPSGIEAVRRVDLGFFEALLERDIHALEVLLADEFMIVDVASGSVHPRATFLAAISGRRSARRRSPISSRSGRACRRRIHRSTST